MFDIRRLNPDSDRPPFSCGDDDLDEYYTNDSVEGAKLLVAVTYAIFDENGTIKAFFSLSNDAIRRDDGKSAFRRMMDNLPRGKRYPSMPSVKIGRLGVCANSQREGWGGTVIDWLKASLTTQNKTGCRYIIVDAYNKPHVIRFYQNQGFVFLTGNDKNRVNRTMYLDLLPLANSRFESGAEEVVEAADATAAIA